MHADLNFKLVRIIYTLKYNNTKRLNKIEKVKNIM